MSSVNTWVLHWMGGASSTNGPTTVNVPYELRSTSPRWVRLREFVGYINAGTGNLAPTIGEVVFSLPTIGTSITDPTVATGGGIRWCSFPVTSAYNANTSGVGTTGCVPSAWSSMSNFNSWPQSIQCQYTQAPNWNAAGAAGTSFTFRCVLEFWDGEAYPHGL